ncbi:hypothetical protein Taro_028886, partial [Colocasia esculenta]|nr:hypothetical protein [Colocasia esculenta]
LKRRTATRRASRSAAAKADATGANGDGSVRWRRTWGEQECGAAASGANDAGGDCARRGGDDRFIEDILPESDSLDVILPELAATGGNVIGKFQPKVRPRPSKLISLSSGLTSTKNSVSSGALSPSEETRILSILEPLEEGLLQVFEASETPLSGAAGSRVGDLQTDQGPSEGEEESELYEDILSQPTLSSGKSSNWDNGTLAILFCNELILTSLSFSICIDSKAKGVGKFQPKLGAKMKKAKAIASNSLCGMEGARTSEILSPEIVSHESPVLGFPADSSASLEHPINDVPRENEKAFAVKAASPDNCRKLDSSDGTIEKDMVNSQKRRSLIQGASGGTVQSHSQGILDRGGSTIEGFEVNDGNRSTRQLRKRTSICTVVTEPDDENGEDWEVGADKLNDSPMPEESSDDEFMGQTSGKKRRPKKSRGSQDEKPTQRPKEASLGSDSSTQEPLKKKFPHSTRRSIRQVDKVLLETPEEDIDPMRLRIKDLIMLAEARERTAVRLKKQQQRVNSLKIKGIKILYSVNCELLCKSCRLIYQSEALYAASLCDSSFYNNSSLGNDNQEQGLNVDGDEADQTAQFSSTKLNYHTYMNRIRSDRWSKVDTELFYQAVRQFGSDFAMIQQLFPNRTRHQIKLKFKNEERKHPLQIADALIHRSNDHSQFQLVIQRLQAQEEENSNADATEDARDEAQPQPKTSENEEEDQVKIDKKEEEVEEVEVDDWDQGHEAADPNEYQEVFDWSQYGVQNSSSPYNMEKDEYNIF